MCKGLLRLAMRPALSPSGAIAIVPSARRMFFTATARRAAPKRPPVTDGTAAKTEKSSKTAKPSKTERAPRVIDAAELAAEETRLSESDTRMAMRLLMQHHFFNEYNTRRPEEQRIGEERQRLQEKHRARIERIEQKTRNSMRLGSDVSVDGILPLYQRPRDAASRWMRPNGVAAEAPLLAAPDTSVYDDAHDQRVRSADVLEEERRRRREELRGGSAASKLLSMEEMDEESGGISAQSVVRSQLMDDEDEDFAVQAYAFSSDE